MRAKLPSMKDYHAEALAHAMTQDDPRVQAIHKANVARVKGAASSDAKHLAPQRVKTWECSMGQCYDGKRNGNKKVKQ